MQPRKHSGNLRFYLYTHGWDIIDEDLAPEGKFVCEVITAVPSDNVTSMEAPYDEEDIRWKYPDAIVKADPVLACKRIGWKIGSIEEQIENLSRSSLDNSELISKLEKDRDYLRKLISY